MSIPPKIHGSAEFADHPLGRQRIRLDRWWSDEPRALVCMQNPSKAGATENDPTIWRLVHLLHHRAGIGGFTVVNVYPHIATDPKDLRAWEQKAVWNTPNLLADIRQQNVDLIRALALTAAVRIPAWGAMDLAPSYGRQVRAALSVDGLHDLHCFGTTARGQPKHPLARGHHRIPDDAPLIVWQPGRMSDVA